ncbi:MAG: YveK family protein [Enterococcus sp.]
MEETISLEEIFGILKKRLMMILVSLLVGIVVAGGVTFFLLTPQYSSSAQMIVQNEQTQTGNANLQADINGNVLLINTYKDMIMGDVVINDVQKRLADEKNYNLSNAELKAMVAVEQSQNSQMFQIQATSDNPDEAAAIANMTATVFKEKASEVLNVSKVTITSDAIVPTSPVSPNNKLNLAIGAVLGLMVGIGLAFVLEFLDKTVKDQKFVSDELGLPLMGVITEFNSKELTAGLTVNLQNTIDPESADEQDKQPPKQSGRRRTRNRV